MVKRLRCASCESLPDAIPVAGTLFLAAPLEHTQQKIVDHLAAEVVEYTTPEPSILRLVFQDDGLPDILQWLSDHLTVNECDETRVLLLREGQDPELSSFLLADRLANLVKRSRSRWLVDVLASSALVTHFQPIVASAEPGQLFGYEALTRGIAPGGELIPPLALYDAAVTADLLYHLDRAARIGAITAAARHDIDSTVFINFTPSSIYTPEFCLRSTIAAMRRTTLSPNRIVFEVVETDRVLDMTHLEGILTTYRNEGFGIALDDLGAGFASMQLLTVLRPDFVKLDISLVRGVEADRYKATVASKLLETASSLGVESVAEGVETEAEWRWLTENGATYQQGFLFGRPATPPPTMIDGPAARGAGRDEFASVSNPKG